MTDDDSIASPSSSVAPSPTKELHTHDLLKGDLVHSMNLEPQFSKIGSALRADTELTDTPQINSIDRTPACIEQEIRHAIDSAAARVQEELGRHDEFENELRTALAYELPGSTVEVNDDAQHLNENEGFDDFVASLLHSGSSSALAPKLAHDTQGEQLPTSGELLLIMEVVIGEAHSETIEVHAGDFPDALAAEFAAKHSLQAEAVPTLSRHIQDQLDALAETEKELATGAGEDANTRTRIAAPESIRNVVYKEDHSTQQFDSQESVHFDHDALKVFPPPAPDDLGSIEQTHQRGNHHRGHTERRGVANSMDVNPVAGQHEPTDDRRARENEREYSYNCIMAKYGHYSQHSGKVDPSARPTSRSEGLTMRNIELAERTRVVDSGRGSISSVREKHAKSGTDSLKRSSTAPRSIPTMTTSANGTKKKKKPAPAPVFQRLYALAESKDKWIQRAQRAKAAEEEREQEELQKHAVGSGARSAGGKGTYNCSGEFSSSRAGGNHNHAGERLYEEALADLAKKERQREQRAVEREHQIDWMCPKCAFVNNHNDEWCKNIVSVVVPASTSANTLSGAGAGKSRRSSTSPLHEIQKSKNQQQSAEAVCGQPKPAHLFRPTLMTAPAGVARAISRNKEKATALSRKPVDPSVTRRERSQRAMEEEFQRTCTFRPKINETSEEIVREKLEIEARAAGLTASPTKSPAGESVMDMVDADAGELLRQRQRRDPYLALYENAFQTRANKEAREREYMAQFSFKPDIGVNALWAPVDESQEAFVERLAVSKYREFERRREALVDKYAPRNRDPDTGRELFKPEVGRGPAFNRNERNLPIGDFLYEAHKEHREYLRQLEAQHELEIRERQSRGFVSESSHRALERRKKDTCARIFDALLKLQDKVVSDSTSASINAGVEPQETLDLPNHADNLTTSPDSDLALGNISGDIIGSGKTIHPRQIDLSKLPAEIGRVVAIIFEFAEYEDLSRTAFATHMETLVREVPGLTYTQVLFLANLLDDGKSSRRRYDAQAAATTAQTNEAAELTFTPSIDKNSRTIAIKHGRSEQSKVFLVLNQYFNHYKKKREQMARQQWREFEKSHPFQPKLVTKRHERQRAAEGFYERIAQLEEAQRRVAPAGPALPTAIANARPSVRRIDVDDPPLLAACDFEASLHSVPAENSSDATACAGPEDEDAELTSRVLAALDEAHAASAGSGTGDGEGPSIAMLSALVREGISLSR